MSFMQQLSDLKIGLQKSRYEVKGRQFAQFHSALQPPSTGPFPASRQHTTMSESNSSEDLFTLVQSSNVLNEQIIPDRPKVGCTNEEGEDVSNCPHHRHQPPSKVQHSTQHSTSRPRSADAPPASRVGPTVPASATKATSTSRPLIPQTRPTAHLSNPQATSTSLQPTPQTTSPYHPSALRAITTAPSSAPQVTRTATPPDLQARITAAFSASPDRPPVSPFTWRKQPSRSASPSLFHPLDSPIPPSASQEGSSAPASTTRFQRLSKPTAASQQARFPLWLQAPAQTVHGPSPRPTSSQSGNNDIATSAQASSSPHRVHWPFLQQASSPNSRFPAPLFPYHASAFEGPPSVHQVGPPGQHAAPSVHHAPPTHRAPPSAHHVLPADHTSASHRAAPLQAMSRYHPESIVAIHLTVQSTCPPF